MVSDATELRQRVAEVDERIDRIGKRFTAGYGSNDDRAGWLAWLRDLQIETGRTSEKLSETGRRAEEPPRPGRARLEFAVPKRGHGADRRDRHQHG